MKVPAGTFEDGSTKFELGPYLLEVKATTSGAARLTPKQAETASAEQARYVLCVVDLRGISDEELDAEWTAERVEPQARLVPGIGIDVYNTCHLVAEARTGLVAIRNEDALRYEVNPALWEQGLSIASWVAQLTPESRLEATEP